MSSQHYTDRRPIPANIVAEKAIGYASRSQRSLLFCLQAMSMEAGGLDQFVTDFLASLNKDDSSRTQGWLAAKLWYLFDDDDEPGKPASSAQVQYTLYLAGYDAATALGAQVKVLRSFIVGLHRRSFLDHSFATKILIYRAHRKARRNRLSPGRTKWKPPVAADRQPLNRALASRRMIVIEGPAGCGKTNSADAWCSAHLGEARFVTLSGITHRTGFFQRIATALGIATCQRKSSELQAKIESFFHRTKLMLVIDESHNLWPPAERVYTSPELIDWVDTALVNSGVPVALICTDQFAKRKTRVEKQTGWTSEQFIHRAYRYHKLDTEKLTEKDVRAVTRNLLSMRWNETADAWVYDATVKLEAEAVDLISAYAFPHALPLPSVRSIIEEARFLAHDGKGRDIVFLSDVANAVDSQQCSDLAIRNAFNPRSKSSNEQEAGPPRKPLVMRPTPPPARSASRQTSPLLNHQRSPAMASSRA